MKFTPKNIKRQLTFCVNFCEEWILSHIWVERGKDFPLIITDYVTIFSVISNLHVKFVVKLLGAGDQDVGIDVQELSDGQLVG
jgi:hypothetical protein